MILEIFKSHLDGGTNEGLRFNDESLSRFVSFKKCIDQLSLLSAPKILELGTSRSFVNGAFEGCNSSDTKYWNSSDISRWDWGAGCFTIIFSMNLPNADIITLDLMREHIYRCKHMTDSLAITNVTHIISDSIDFLNTTNDKYDLIYLDTGDMWPIEPTQDLQLRESKAIVQRNLLKDNGILLIDDVLNGTPKEQGNSQVKYGKSDLSLQYLKENGFNIIFEGYQYILSK